MNAFGLKQHSQSVNPGADSGWFMVKMGNNMVVSNLQRKNNKSMDRLFSSLSFSFHWFFLNIRPVFLSHIVKVSGCSGCSNIIPNTEHLCSDCQVHITFDLVSYTIYLYAAKIFDVLLFGRPTGLLAHKKLIFLVVKLLLAYMPELQILAF